MTNVDTLWDQETIFPDDTARARGDDSLASHRAADESARTISEVRRAVLALVEQLGSANGHDLNDFYSLYAPNRGWPRVAYDSPRKRAGELLRDGLLAVANPDDKRGVPAIYTAVK